MRLNELITMLGASEIFSYDMVDMDTGTLNPVHRRRILQLINLGLSDLHVRFNLREDVLRLQPKPDVFRYKLEPTQNLSINSEGYIDDTQYPFTGNIIEILRIQLPSGRLLNLNQSQTYVSRRDGVYAHDQSAVSNHLISTPSFNELLFSYTPSQGEYLVHYKAYGEKISLDGLEDLDASAIEVDLPNAYMNALCYFVGSKVYNPAGAESVARSMFHEGNNWSSKYEAECSRLKNELAGSKVLTEVSNFTRGGWV